MVAMVPLLTPVSGYYTTFYNHIAMVLTPLRDLGKTMEEPHSILQQLSDDSFSLSNYGNYRTMPESSRKVICPKEKTAGLKTTPGKEIEETNFNGTRAAPEIIENNMSLNNTETELSS